MRGVQIFLILSIINLISPISLGWYSSNSISLSNGIYSLNGLTAYCPGNGAMKTLQFKYEGGRFYYNFQCYSSNTASVEYDDAVLKVYTETKTTNYDQCTDNRFIYIDRHQIACTKDFALSGLYLEWNRNQQCRFQYKCVAVKSTYEDTNVQAKATSWVNAYRGDFSGINQLVAGSQDKSDRNALHSFRLNMKYDTYNWEARFFYGVITLRDMGKVKDDYKEKSKALRESVEGK